MEKAAYGSSGKAVLWPKTTTVTVSQESATGVTHYWRKTTTVVRQAFHKGGKKTNGCSHPAVGAVEVCPGAVVQMEPGLFLTGAVIKDSEREKKRGEFVLGLKRPSCVRTNHMLPPELLSNTTLQEVAFCQSSVMRRLRLFCFCSFLRE